MIIEASPRPREGPQKGYPPSSYKSQAGLNLETDHKTSHASQLGNQRGVIITRPQKLFETAQNPSSEHCKLKRIPSNRGHPYRREDKRPSEDDKWNSFVSLLSHQGGSSTQQHRAELSKLPFHTPYFTANANENNDNCPRPAYVGGGFTVNRNIPALSPTSRSPDTICDVEIEDLTTENSDFCRNSAFNAGNPWRQRRKSFNTNPLSSNPDHQRNDSLSRTKKQEENQQRHRISNEVRKANIYQLLGIEPGELNFSNIDKRHVASQTSKPKNTEEFVEFPSTIERLVEFFESNSSHQRDCNNNVTGFESSAIPSPCRKFEKHSTREHFRHSENTPFHYPNPSSSRGKDIDNHRSFREIPSPIDLSSIIRNASWDSVIQSTEYSQSRSSRPHTKTSLNTGCVFNNNGNAASTSTDSRSLWPGNQLGRDHFSPISYQENKQKTILPTTSSTSSTSALFLPPNRGRCASSLATVSTDVELIDLESTRLSTWPGSSSIPSALNRPKFENSESLRGADSLIDLHSTAKRVDSRSSSWLKNFADSTSSRESQRALEFSQFASNSSRASSNQERFRESPQGSLRQGGKVQAVTSASVNNHHNAPSSKSKFCRFGGFNNEPKRYDIVAPNKTEVWEERQFPFGDFTFHHSLLDPLLRKKGNFFRSESCDMGCIQSIAKSKVSPDRCHHGVIVENINAAIDRTRTEIEEKSPIVLRYRTPYFRASAHVIVPPIPRKETWTVGWIQACDSMKFINQYGNLGNSSWEIPALKDRRITAVSDSDGVSYPWYGNTTEIATVEGPTDTSRSLTLRMNDNFYPSVTWDIPVSEGSEAHLTHIVRDQSFTTWLAAVNQTTGRLEVLRTVKWHFYLEIDVDPSKELGNRACIVSPLEQKQPIILKNNTEPIYLSSPRRNNTTGSTGAGGRQKRLNRRPGAGGDNNSNNHTNIIPKSALVRPSANNAQTLIWRPSGDVPVIVVPAKEEYKENNEVVWFSRTPTMHGHDHNVRILSLQEMSQLKKTIS